MKGIRGQGLGVSKTPKLTAAGRELMKRENTFAGEIASIRSSLEVAITAIEEADRELRALQKKRSKERAGW